MCDVSRSAGRGFAGVPRGHRDEFELLITKFSALSLLGLGQSLSA